MEQGGAKKSQKRAKRVNWEQVSNREGATDCEQERATVSKEQGKSNWEQGRAKKSTGGTKKSNEEQVRSREKGEQGKMWESPISSYTL